MANLALYWCVAMCTIRRLTLQFKSSNMLSNELFAITDRPIKRFGSMLVSKESFCEDMRLLKDIFANVNFNDVMCRPYFD